MTRSLLLASAGVLALTAGSASAQGLPAPAAGAVNWTGGYAGFLAGAGFTANRWTDVNGIYANFGTSASYSSNPVGVALGVFAGYNWQLAANAIVGIEADLTYNSASGRAATPFVLASANYKAQFAGSLRARVGFTADRALFFVTGGLALGNPSATFIDLGNNPSTIARSNSLRAGFVVGAGVEYMVSQSWTARLEALYYDFGTTTPADVGGTGYVMRTRSSQTQVRLGAAYRF